MKALSGATALATWLVVMGTCHGADDVGWAEDHRRPAQVAVDASAQAPLLSSTDNYAARFRGVGQLTANSQCTATLVAATATPPDNARALVLTAGHCVNYFNQNQVWADRPAEAQWRFTPAFFHDTQAQHKAYPIRRVLYATMKTIDLAVLELDTTYGVLKADAIAPLRVRAFEHDVRRIELVQVPVLGVEPGTQFLRHAECTTQPRQAIYESFFPWFWPRAVGNDCAGVAGGSSGSPVVERNEHTIIGVLNTTLDRGFNGCGLARPCEINAQQQATAREGTSYFTSVESLVPAFKADGTFDTTTLDIEPEVQLLRSYQQVWVTRSWIPDEQGVLQPARWGLQLGGPFEQVRVKVGGAQSTDCDKMDGYGEPQALSRQPLLHLVTPAAEGVYIACVIGKPTGQPWQQHASSALREIDNTPPTSRPTLSRRDDENNWRVMANSAPNELSSVMYKVGSPDVVRCDEPQDYRPQLNNQFRTLDKRSAWRFCTYGRDLAENQGPVLQEDFTPAGQ